MEEKQQQQRKYETIQSTSDDTIVKRLNTFDL